MADVFSVEEFGFSKTSSCANWPITWPKKMAFNHEASWQITLPDCVWLSCGRFAFVEDVLSTGGKWRRYLMRMSLAKVVLGVHLRKLLEPSQNQRTSYIIHNIYISIYAACKCRLGWCRMSVKHSVNIFLSWKVTNRSAADCGQSILDRLVDVILF